MNNPALRTTAVVAFVISLATTAVAQVISQPTPVPIVTAENESWYLLGDPITYSGYSFYPAGAQVAFNPNEMVRSGFYLGVPIYTRTTDEPFSVIYVPVTRGFLRPYMRPRTGDMGGTAGTSAMAGVAAAFSSQAATARTFQAAGPPPLVAGAPADETGQPRAPIPAVAPTQRAAPGSAETPRSPAATVATSGQEDTTTALATHTRIGPPPQGLNGVFIQYRDRRWFSEGQAVELDRTRMIEVGEYFGFPVYVDREAPEQRIYVAVTKAGALVVAPYSQRKSN